MFDTTYIAPSSREYVPYEKTVTVTENRAVTDESVKLYAEMVDKAKESLFDSFTLTSPWLGEIQIAVHKDFVKYKQNYNISFRVQLNNDYICGNVPIQLVDDDYNEKTRSQIVDEVVKGVGEKIASTIREPLFRGILSDHELCEELIKR